LIATGSKVPTAATGAVSTAAQTEAHIEIVDPNFDPNAGATGYTPPGSVADRPKMAASLRSWAPSPDPDPFAKALPKSKAKKVTAPVPPPIEEVGSRTVSKPTPEVASPWQSSNAADAGVKDGKLDAEPTIPATEPLFIIKHKMDPMHDPRKTAIPIFHAVAALYASRTPLCATTALVSA
jgi:hypothetical protein